VKILGWIAWSETHRYDSRSCTPSDLPDNLQWVTVYKEGGYREMLTGAMSDEDVWYVFYPDKAVKKEEGSRLSVQERHPSGYLVKGSWTSDDNYERITNEAWADKEFVGEIL
jgi:hypothetical protein